VIASERWIWRNLPPAPGFTGNAAETSLACRLPISWMGRRAMHRRRLAYSTRSAGSQLLGAAPESDERVPGAGSRQGAVAHGYTGSARTRDYLRYSTRFRSRYAPVLKHPLRARSGKRRIAVAFRGDRTKI
jgi:hypothetical protein